jgi:hypothetical protein
MLCSQSKMLCAPIKMAEEQSKKACSQSKKLCSLCKMLCARLRQEPRHCEERGTSNAAIFQSRLEIGFAELRFAPVASLNPLAMTMGGVIRY